MAHVSHRLKSPFEGALAGGGDPATSPLYVFGPFLKLLVASGAGAACFGAPIWLVVLTVVVVSLMYRRVMRWVPDGSGGSGLCEEEFGSWAVKVNAGITVIEYTLTFLVSVAALVTFVADRLPAFGGRWQRTLLAVGLSVLTGAVVNRGPRVAARVFGPATGAVLALLWGLVLAVVFERGLRLPSFDPAAFAGHNLHVTLGGYVRLLALMTGIEVFANLVAAYDGAPAERARKAFGSLVIIMVTTLATMVVVGPAVYDLSDPAREDVSVFTQTMDRLLPGPLAYLGSLVGIVVLLSAAAASAQGLQNLALGLRHRHYVPAAFGQRNRFDVADRPVVLQVGAVVACFVAFGTREETYLALYAAGVFVLLALTGWAAVKRQARELRQGGGARAAGPLAATAVAAALTSGAAALIFVERFAEGAWSYLLLVPALYAAFSRYRMRLGAPEPIEDRLGRVLAEQRTPSEAAPLVWPRTILTVVDGSLEGEAAVLCAVGMAARSQAPAFLCVVGKDRDLRDYGTLLARLLVEIPEAEVPSFLDDVGAIGLAVRRVGADLVVASADRPALRALPKHAGAPVLFVRASAPARRRYTLLSNVVVGVDGSSPAEAVLPYVRALLRAGARVVLVVVPDGGEPELLTAYAGRLNEALRPDGPVEVVVTGSGPARTLVSVAEERDADLVVVASHGRGGTSRAVELGSVPTRLLSEFDRPVLVVPSSTHGAVTFASPGVWRDGQRAGEVAG